MIEGDLKRRAKVVEKYIFSRLDRKPEMYYGPMRHLLEAGGKRIRPGLCLLACSACGGDERDAVPFAAAVELVHNFTLIHDDIMDADLVRRGRESVHAKYGVPYAINAGDGMFAIAFQCLADGPRAAEALKVLSIAVREVAEGQTMDMGFEGKQVSEADYFEMIKRKTGVLIEASVRLGALAADAPPNHSDSLAIYGRNIGVAFQIKDDVLDLVTPDDVLGKPSGSDIREGKRSLMVIHCLGRGTAKQRASLLEVLGNSEATKADIETARDVLKQSGSIAYADQKAKELIKEAKGALDPLPGSKSREALLDLADYIVKRKY